MYRILVFLILSGCIIYANTVLVNRSIYEDRIIDLCDERLECGTDEYRFIDIKGYGMLWVDLSGQCTNKPMYGIFQGETYALAIDSSLNFLYDTLQEDWEIEYLPTGLVPVLSHSSALTDVGNFDEVIYLPVVGTLSMHNIITDSTIYLLPLHEWGSWGMDWLPTESWMNTFGNIGEVFYLSREGENTVKLVIIERSNYPNYSLYCASDSLGNGIFKINTTPVITEDPEYLKPASHTVRLINNRLYLPMGLSSGRIHIFNISGQEMLAQTLLQGNHVALPDLSRGFYQYSVTGGGVNYRGTFLKLD